jgi:uncharacterized protein (TIGR02391 family)
MGKSLGHEISDELWNDIKANYNSNDYSGAVTDAIFNLSKLLREKLATDKDGTSLIQYAFGGAQPRLKITPMRTQTEKNIHSGIQKILEGIMLAIRNSHHHEQPENSRESCNSIIFFIDYLLPFIKNAKTEFETLEFVYNLMNDNFFVRSQEYADEIIKTIPIKYYLSILIAIVENFDSDNSIKLDIFFNTLISKLSKNEQNDFYGLIKL